MRLAVDVAGQVLRGPAQLDEDLLEMAALGGVDDDVGGGQARPEQALGALGAQDLLQDGHVGGVQDQAVGRIGDQLEAAVAAHGLGDLGEQGVRHREARVADEDVDDGLGVQAGGAGVPQGERGDPVGVDVLRRPLQLREGGDGATGIIGAGAGHLQEDRFVGLDDEGAVGRRRVGHDGQYPKSRGARAVIRATCSSDCFRDAGPLRSCAGARVRPASAVDQGQVGQDRAQGEKASGEEFRDGESHDVRGPAQVGHEPVGLGGAQAPGDEPESQGQLAGVDGVDVEVNGEP